jgi:signal-transduction protein with cAMP-binding, CBS, and nucleotidyltransferase domain
MAEKRIGSLVVIKDGQVIGILPSVIMLDRLALRAETRRKPYVV